MDYRLQTRGKTVLVVLRRSVACLATATLIPGCHATDPAAPVLRALPGTVTGAAAASIGDNGLFLLPAAPSEGYPQITAQQARALAAVWLRSYAPLVRTQLQREHGGPLDFAHLQECRIVYARTPYQPLPAEAPLALRNLVAGKFLVTFCNGITPAISVSIASSAVHLDIQGDFIVFPREHGNEFVGYGIPRGFSGAPLSPEHAAGVAYSRTVRRVSEVRELWLRHAFHAPQNAVWRLRLVSSIAFRSGADLPVRETSEVFVATGSNAKGQVLRGLSAALGDTPETPPVLSARVAPGEAVTIQYPLSYRPGAPQGFTALVIEGAQR